MAKRSPNDAYNSYKVRHRKPNKFTPKKPLMTLEEYNESRRTGKKTKAGRHLHEFSQKGTRFPFLWYYGSEEDLKAHISKLKSTGKPRSIKRAEMLQTVLNELTEAIAEV